MPSLLEEQHQRVLGQGLLRQDRDRQAQEKESDATRRGRPVRAAAF
jgi:hypothetical protein